MMIKYISEYITNSEVSEQIIAALKAGQKMRDSFSDVLSSSISDYMDDDFRRKYTFEIKAWDKATKGDE